MNVKSLAPLALVLLGAASVSAQITSVDEALALARKTGRPIFAMAGNRTCPACVALQGQLETDQSLSKFKGQIVPLKVTTDGNADWGKWASKYPVEGNSIPIVYVIRPDGEKLYAAAGAPDDLEGMLSAAMEKSGRSFSDKEVALLTECVSSAKQAVAEGSNFQAALALTRLSPLGPLGNLKSYSELAQEANALTKQVIEAAEKSLAEANTQVGATETSFPGVLTIVEAERAYAAFPTLKATAIKSLKDVEKNQALAEPLRQAQALVRARRLPTVGNPTLKAKAIEAYVAVINRYPGTEAGKLAVAELTAIDPQKAEAAQATAAAKPAAGSATEEFRTWTSGTFTVEAKFIQQKQGFVQLEKRDGKKISIQIEKLSAADQEVLKLK